MASRNISDVIGQIQVVMKAPGSITNPPSDVHHYVV